MLFLELDFYSLMCVEHADEEKSVHFVGMYRAYFCLLHVEVKNVQGFLTKPNNIVSCVYFKSKKNLKYGKFVGITILGTAWLLGLL